MIINRSYDLDAISYIMNHETVRNSIVDDIGANDSKIIIPYHEDIIYLTNELNQGVIRLDPMNNIFCQAHIAVLPELYGNAVAFVKKALVWGCLNTRYMKVITFIPVFNRLTLKLIQACKFKKEGVVTQSFLKNWKLNDQQIYGITKKEILQWQ